MTTETQTTATDAFVSSMSEVRSILAKLTAAADDHFGSTPDSVNWGHVGDAGRTIQQLQEVLDRVTESGEYSKVT